MDQMKIKRGRNLRGNYFVAFPAKVPESVQQRVKRGAPEGLRWFHGDDLHVTLAFFGKEESERIPAIRGVLQEIAFAGSEFTLGRIIALPHLRRFSALSFEIAEGREEIAHLMEMWRAPLAAAAGVPPENRRPLPHVTVARPVRKDPRFRAKEVLAWANGFPPPEEKVELLRPMLFVWAADRATRQFQILEGRGDAENSLSGEDHL